MRFAHCILYVPDVRAALAFYAAAFGLAERFCDPAGQYAELETGATAVAFCAEALADTHGTGYAPQRPVGRAPAFELALVADDVAAAYAHAISAGCAGVAAPRRMPWGQTVAYVRDLNGFVVELCSALDA